MVTQLEKIIIIGAGFAGLSAAYRLAKSGFAKNITLIDKKEQADFLPLIPDCLGRGIQSKFLSYDIVEFCRKFKINFIKEEVISLDFKSKRVFTSAVDHVYDYLIISSGSQTNFFVNQDAQNYAYSLNSVNDVKNILQELKSNKFDNFVICGGGYTGVEAATNLWLYAKKNSLDKNIIIVERAPTILGLLPEWMKAYVENNLSNLGIKIIINSGIDKIQVNQVSLLTGQVFDKAMLIWVPGVRTAEFIQKLNINKNSQGRIVVDDYLKVNPNCFCAGDTALFKDKNSFLRMAIQFAINQGAQAADNIIRSIKGIKLKKFRPLDLGYIIPMANNCSCGVVFGCNLKGLLPTVLHYMMCIFRLSGLKNRWGLICALLGQKGKKC